MKIKIILQFILASFLVLGAFVAVPVVPVRADTKIVSNINDSGVGSLRQAIADAVDGDTIDASGISGTIVLASQLSINKDLTILGPGSGALTVSGNNAVRIFYIDSGKTVSISGLTVSNGHVVDNHGAGINNLGDLTLDDVHVTNNVVEVNIAPPQLRGGGIHSYDGSSLSVTNSVISGNTAVQNGGGIHIGFGGAVSLENVVIDDNHLSDINSIGGGITIRGEGTTATLNNVTISNNSASNSGGGLYADASLTLTNSLIADNFTTTSNFGGSGGGLYLYGSGQTFTLTNVTISGNLAENVNDNAPGGGILLADQAILNLNNVTIAGNTSDGAGGGIYAQNLTTVNTRNTIIGNNTASTATSDDCAGTLNSLGYNLIQVTSGCSINGDTTGNITNTNPNLGALADNGGPTQTMALLPGSPAIDAGDDDFCPATDQRGVTRPQGGQCDIGAYEFSITVDVEIGGDLQGSYQLTSGEERREYYNVSGGPVKVESTNGTEIVSAIRLQSFANNTLYSFVETMGVPQGLLSHKYYFPTYNNTWGPLNSQVRFGNLDTNSTTIRVTIGGSVVWEEAVPGLEERRLTFPVSGGPVVIESLDVSKKIVAAIRLQSYANDTLHSFAETMGIPNEYISHEYYFPTYNNTWAPLNSQVRFGNLDASSTTIRVTIGGVNVWEDEVPGLEERRLTFDVSGGPVKVESLDPSKKIVAAIRLQSFANNTLHSFVETMGVPSGLLSHKYFFPTYNNTWAPLNSQVRFGNLDADPTTIRVTIGGVNVWEDEVPGLEERRLYFDVSGGPVVIESLDVSKKIVAAIRLQSFANNTLYSFSETMGIPAEQMSDVYYFPTYNNTWGPLNSQLRFGVP
jgi:predicted outer membrane repeat protein